MIFQTTTEVLLSVLAYVAIIRVMQLEIKLRAGRFEWMRLYRSNLSISKRYFDEKDKLRLLTEFTQKMKLPKGRKLKRKN